MTINPNQSDTDQDGLPDGWEVAYAAYGVNPVLSATTCWVGWWKLDEWAAAQTPTIPPPMPITAR